MSDAFEQAKAYYKSERPAARTRRARAIVRTLLEEFPDPKCALIHRNPFELLISTILSAQSTDEQVNRATPALFAAYPDAPSLAAAPIEHVMELIRSTGFFNNKAKSITACAKELVIRFGGAVPPAMEELITLPGVGRKTANVVLGNAFDIPGLPVDTHVRRIANLLALTVSDNPEIIEQELCAMLPREQWTDASHVIIFHGRKTCIARRPKCAECPIAVKCPSRAPR